MLDEFGVLIGLFTAIVGVVIATVGPLLKLNTSITKLNEHIRCIIDDSKKRDKRLDNHSDRLDKMEHIVTEHSVKIDRLSEYHKIN